MLKHKSTGIPWFSEEDIECIGNTLLIAVFQHGVPKTKTQNIMLCKQLRSYTSKSSETTNKRHWFSKKNWICKCHVKVMKIKTFLDENFLQREHHFTLMGMSVITAINSGGQNGLMKFLICV
jgi:hypothetical protein